MRSIRERILTMPNGTESKVVVSLLGKQLHEQQITSPPKLQSVNETVQSMHLIPIINKITHSQFSASPNPKKLLDNFDQSQKSSKGDSIGPSNGSTIYDEASSRYQCIAQLTQQQNINLKQQNEYLIQKLRKMQQRESKVKKLYQKAKKYKALYQQIQLQIDVLLDQCQVYKDQAQQMKKIVLNDVYRLREKIMETEMENNVSHELLEKKIEIVPTQQQQIDVLHQDELENKNYL